MKHSVVILYLAVVENHKVYKLKDTKINMGHNIDLINLLGLPEKVNCPKCNNMVHTSFDEYDIDCGDPEADVNCGLLNLHVYCDICENEFEVKFKTTRVEK